MYVNAGPSSSVIEYSCCILYARIIIIVTKKVTIRTRYNCIYVYTLNYIRLRRDHIVVVVIVRYFYWLIGCHFNFFFSLSK